MRKKEMIAMLLAGGQGSRLGVLTKNKAKPAAAFGGKYRIIDFPMSNCINSGVDTVGVLTQYQPLQLNRHIGIGIPWDLDRRYGGVTILAPHVKEGEQGYWYSGTADAIYQNINFIDTYNPTYVLIISGDHIYKMDYGSMLAHHKKTGADATIGVLEVAWEEAARFGIMNTDETGKIQSFEEKPEQPNSNLASMGIYIFTWDMLRRALLEAHDIHDDTDFGKHLIPMYLEQNKNLYAYRFDGYWKDVGTIDSYWAANMDLIKTTPDFNLYEDFAKIYTSSHHQPPQFSGANSHIRQSLISEGCEIFGTVVNSILGPNVFVAEGAVINDSIIMEGSIIGENACLNKVIVDENCNIGRDAQLGVGENIANQLKPQVYNTGISVVGEGSAVPDGVVVGRNCVIYGITTAEYYINGRLESGQTLDITGEVQE
ncbi:MAG: glucose-1-phosphate adenylyltransferase [Defluviitaleaceae bacterium]|nr:glucose-1-phosphate adenylyltransferase [Defluviitaleaceae bacterium]